MNDLKASEAGSLENKNVLVRDDSPELGDVTGIIEEGGIKRGLKTRHAQMIALGMCTLLEIWMFVAAKQNHQLCCDVRTDPQAEDNTNNSLLRWYYWNRSFRWKWSTPGQGRSCILTLSISHHGLPCPLRCHSDCRSCNVSSS